MADTPDLSPLGAQREWVQQAEDNAVERLFQAGIIDAPSDFDKTLEALAPHPGLQQRHAFAPDPLPDDTHRAA